jgi:hypothetical protein
MMEATAASPVCGLGVWDAAGMAAKAKMGKRTFFKFHLRKRTRFRK